MANGVEQGSKELLHRHLRSQMTEQSSPFLGALATTEGEGAIHQDAAHDERVSEAASHGHRLFATRRIAQHVLGAENFRG